MEGKQRQKTRRRTHHAGDADWAAFLVVSPQDAVAKADTKKKPAKDNVAKSEANIQEYSAKLLTKFYCRRKKTSRVLTPTALMTAPTRTIPQAPRQQLGIWYLAAA